MGGIGSAIDFRKVSIVYRPYSVVEDFSLAVSSGEVVCLFGPSGCGKSTLLKAAIGAIEPVTGEIRVEGHKASEYRLPVSYMPQENELFRWLDVRQNVELWARESSRRAKRRTAISPDDALDLVELNDVSGKMPYELSGGMARRTALARCLATHSDIMLLDETFVAIERRLRRKIMTAVRSHLKKQHLTTLLVSHDYEEAAFMSDRVVFLTPVPAQIKNIAVVSLPIDRGIELFESVAFRDATIELVSN